MPLKDIWLSTRWQLEDKQVEQIIRFAGEGALLDENEASREYREFLSHIPVSFLEKYTNQCLNTPFKDSGLALQDIVNEMGRRLGFQVKNGRYRGSSNHIGFDGLWKLSNEHSIIVEVKVTDAYRIDLNTIAEYRRKLINHGVIGETNSSILIIVGREDTGDLEAQIRGSKHAWDIRLISTDALIRLMMLREEVEDPKIIQRMYNILIPREFTKLDEIIDILFSTAEEVKHIEVDEPVQSQQSDDTDAPASFTESCIALVEQNLRCSLVKRSRASFSSPDNKVSVVCLVSKEHIRPGHIKYWFAFRPTQKEFLSQSENSYISLGCGSEKNTLLIPFTVFSAWVEEMTITEMDDRYYWHVDIHVVDNKFMLHRKRGTKPADITKYLLPV